MNPEQQTQLSAFLETLADMSVDQLFESFHQARLSKAESSEAETPYWRAVLIGIGNQLHRRLGPGALQEYGRRYVEQP